MKTIGNLTTGTTSDFNFQKTCILNESGLAYNILDELMPEGWYPENAETEWTDILVLDGKYYAAFGEDSLTVNNAKVVYIEIEPSENMIKEYEYFKQY